MEPSEVSKDDAFSLWQMESAFGHLKHRIQKLYPEEIITYCLRILTKPDATRTQSIVNNKPWELLLLIKWTIIYGDFKSQKRRHVNDREFDYLRKLLYDLNGTARLPSQYKNHFLFLRNLAFQQFWLQEEFSATQISRQHLIFGNLAKDHPFQDTFRKETNLSINDFLELSFALTKRVFDNDPVFTANWFSTIKDTYSEGTVENFLNSLGKEIKFLKPYIIETQGRRNISYEFYEQSPLKKYPLLKSGETYCYYFSTLFFRSIETFIYDTLRNLDPHKFMSRFGTMFENYIGIGLQYTELPFINEQILETYSKGGKVVDFVVVDQDTNIFIDAKGVEMGYLGMVSHLPEVVKDRTDVSVIKGIKQGYETARLLKGVDSINGIQLGKEEAYLLIVTFKDLYIGNGMVFYNYIAKDTIDEIIAEYGEQLIPLQNMYFISVNDIDEFFYCIKQGIRAKTILAHAVSADEKTETMKFVFRQHLEELKLAHPLIPQYLENEYSDFIEKIKSRFGEV